MKKEIIEVNKEKGIIRVTTLDERYYAFPSKNKETGLPEYIYKPSTTWIASYYYTDPYLIKWIADKGLTEAERLKNLAGEKGSKVHYACERIDMGEEVTITSKFVNPTTEQEEEINVEEFEAVLSYVNFLKDYKPQVLEIEQTHFSDISGGTIDRIYAFKVEGKEERQIYITDLKTSKSIYDEHKLQLSDYSHMDIDYKKLGITDKEWADRRLAVLQVGYSLNKKGYKFTEVEDMYDEFRNIAYRIWKKKNPDGKPKQIDLPIMLKSPLFIEQDKVGEDKTKKIKAK